VIAEVERLEPTSGTAALAAAWAELEAAGAVRRTGGTAAWLDAWCRHYTPRGLLGVLVRDGGAVVAAGLLEERSHRRWRFAGAPVTVHRGLVCRPGDEAAAWSALEGWLRRHRGRWSELEAEGGAPGLVVLPGTAATSQPAYGLDLPASLEELLAGRSRSARRELRKAQRRLEGAGARTAVVPDAERDTAIARLVDLHTRRTAAQDRRHAGVDARLVALLQEVARARGPEVRLIETRTADRVLAGAVVLQAGRAAEYYQTGMDPAAAALAPGYGVLLGALEDAMARGVRHVDLGPGEYLYKTRVGGVEAPHWRLIVPSRSAHGLALRGARRAVGRARQLRALAATAAVGRAGGSSSSAR
jgi:CelD/BcsL family acetyltransferase involved in cellulose biosynthesis